MGLWLCAELAAVLGRLHDTGAVLASADRPLLSCTSKHFQYGRQLHTSVMLAQGGSCCFFANQKLPGAFGVTHFAAQDSTKVTPLLAAEPQPAAETSHDDDDESILKDSDKPKEGPLKVYLDGRKSGLYRPDPRQETTIKLLQQLYDELKKLHVDHKRPSGLTTTDHIGADNRPRHSWYRPPHCRISMFLHL